MINKGLRMISKKNLFIRIMCLALPSMLLFLTHMPVMTKGQTAYNPNLIPLGDKESLMGNAGTGGLGSTGAVYYNPGALTLLKGNSLSLSGSAYLQFRYKATPVINIFGTDVDYSATGYQSIPTSLIVAKTYRDWYLAYSILIPMSFRYEGPTTWLIPAGDNNIKMKMMQNYSESIFMAGITAARKLGQGWSVGLSLYGQAYSYLSVVDIRGGIEENPELIVQSSSRNSVNPINLLLIAGIHKSLGSWGLGLRVEAPNMYLFGKGSYYNYWFSNLAGPDNIDVTETDLDNITGQFKTPLDLRLGTVFQPKTRLTLAIDIAYCFGLQYNIFNEPEFKLHESLNGNFRINSGLEYYLRENLAIYGGGSYTPSTLEKTETRFGQDFWAVFAGGKLFSQLLESSVGLYYSRGNGEGTLESGGVKTKQVYEFIGIVLGTSYKF